MQGVNNCILELNRHSVSVELFIFLCIQKSLLVLTMSHILLDLENNEIKGMVPAFLKFRLMRIQPYAHTCSTWI